MMMEGQDGVGLITEAYDANTMRPSIFFRRQNADWIHPVLRPEFLNLRNWRCESRIAIVMHVFYPELWPEMEQALNAMTEAFDLFVTLVGTSERLRADILAKYPRALVLTVDNHGRDILPFLFLLQSRILFQYELLCKLHTKRSFWHEDGDTWRRNLIAGVLGGSHVVRSLLQAFRTDVDLGMVVADGHVYKGHEVWVGNRMHLSRIFPAFGMDEGEFNKAFAGGSVFWIRPSILSAMSQMPIKFDDFELEPLGQDGTLAHALERLISLLCYDAGMRIEETHGVMATYQ
jgi:lipopolysaccharide biosynthesis protein